MHKIKNMINDYFRKERERREYLQYLWSEFKIPTHTNRRLLSGFDYCEPTIIDVENFR